MSHLRRVSVRCYRSIVKADLRLGEITVVVGPSNSGKSNLVRALRDWAYNASGAKFATIGHTVTRVGVAVGRQHKVVFEKEVKGKKTGARFLVADADEGGVVAYEKVGLTVPQEVADVTGVRELAVDDLKVRVHFTEQGEAWFLLTSPPWTPGRTSKVIGRISGLDALILANRDLVNARNALQKAARRHREKADEQRAALDEFDGLDELGELVARAEAAHAGVVADRKTLEAATALLRRIRVKRRQLDALEQFAEAGQAVEDALDASGLLESLDLLAASEESLARLASLRRRADRARAQADRAEADLEAAREALADLAGDEDLECPLCGGEAHAECRAALAEEAAP